MAETIAITLTRPRMTVSVTHISTNFAFSPITRQRTTITWNTRHSSVPHFFSSIPWAKFCPASAPSRSAESSVLHHSVRPAHQSQNRTNGILSTPHILTSSLKYSINRQANTIDIPRGGYLSSAHNLVCMSASYRRLGCATVTPGYFSYYPYPYPWKPVPADTGTGFRRVRVRVFQQPVSIQTCSRVRHCKEGGGPLCHVETRFRQGKKAAPSRHVEMVSTLATSDLGLHCGQAIFNLPKNVPKMNWNVFSSFWTEKGRKMY